MELGGIKQGWKEQTLGDSPVLVDIIASVVAAPKRRATLAMPNQAPQRTLVNSRR
jgi:hypothetical protein